MKKVLFCLMAVFVCLCANAQNFPQNENGDIEFSEVISNSLTKEQMFSNAKEWVATTFGDYKSVIQFEDNENCKLIIKGNSPVDFTSATVEVDGFVGMSSKESLSYTITIECKEEKYRYKVNDIIVNRTYNILGSSVRAKPFTPARNLLNRNTYTAELAELNAIDTSKMKKKALEEHNEKIKSAEKSIKEAELFYKLEYITIQSLVEDLKKAIAFNDDF